MVDSDWGREQMDTLRISWQTRRQRTVALCSTESKYLPLFGTVKESLYLRGILNEVGLTQSLIKLYSDSQSAQSLAISFLYHPRTKHIDVRHHFIREKFNSGEFELEYLATEDMPADILSKAVPAQKHLSCSMNLGDTLNAENILPTSRGGVGGRSVANVTLNLLFTSRPLHPTYTCFSYTWFH